MRHGGGEPGMTGPSPRPQERHRAGPASLALLLLFCGLTVPSILMGSVGGDGLATDAIRYHIPQINAFIADPLNLLDYRATATTLPFYHAVLAWFARLLGIPQVGNGTAAVRLLHFLLCVPGLGALFVHLERRDGWRMILLALPITTSWYVTSASVFFGTDGPALTVVILSLLAAQMMPQRPALNAGLMMLTAAVRHLALPFTAGLFAAPLLWSARPRALLAFAASLLPAVLLLLVYLTHWHGLTPPGMVAGMNPPGLYLYGFLGHLCVLALWVGAFGFCFRLPQWLALLRSRQVQVWSVAFVLLVAMIWFNQPTDFSREHGRFGSIAWQLAPLAMIGQRSLAVLILAAAGAVGALLLYLDQRREGLKPIEVLALLGFLLCLSLTYAAYQRYSEPTILATLAIAFARLGGPVVPWRTIPLLALSGLGLALSVMRLY